MARVGGRVILVLTDMMLKHKRLAIAKEIVRRVDTVTLCTVEEVTDIRQRALTGEFDDIFNEIFVLDNQPSNG